MKKRRRDPPRRVNCETERRSEEQTSLASSPRFGSAHPHTRSPLHLLGPDCEPYIIAEIGVNHDGSVDRALELVSAAALAGADAVKVQYFEAERLTSRISIQVSDLRMLELPVDAMRAVASRAAVCGLDAIATVFCLELVESAETIGWSAYKVASPDIINRPLIDALMATGRPLVLSAGGATVEEVIRAVEWLGDHPFALMQCVSSYPTPDDCASLGGIAVLARAGGQHPSWPLAGGTPAPPVPIGYSDHTTSIDTGALAIAAGACILEKHLTHNRGASGPDHRCSLDPDQFTEYVRLARRAHRMMGPPGRKCVLSIESEVRSASRQSLVTTRRLERGHVIERDDLTIKRPGTGIEPWRLEEVVGRRVNESVDADTTLTESCVEEGTEAPAAAGKLRHGGTK